MTEPLPILILPSWRYHATQGGKLYRTQAELAEAEAQGWRDSPGAAAAVSAEAFPEIDAEFKAAAAAGDEAYKALNVVAKKRKR